METRIVVSNLDMNECISSSWVSLKYASDNRVFMRRPTNNNRMEIEENKVGRI